MAFYILLNKEYEDELIAIYQFIASSERSGRLLLDKVSGEVKELNSISSVNSKAYFTRAAVKIRQHWKTGNLPDKTCWAS